MAPPVSGYTDAPPLTLRPALRRRPFHLSPPLWRGVWLVVAIAVFLGAPFLPALFL